MSSGLRRYPSIPGIVAQHPNFLFSTDRILLVVRRRTFPEVDVEEKWSDTTWWRVGTSRSRGRGHPKWGPEGRVNVG